MTNTTGPLTFPGLDTLRAVASIAVVATHTSFWAGAYDAGLPGAVTQRLEIGVAVFFVLSGFLLSHPWLRHLRTGRPRDSVGRYFFKRALRILPVYWVSVIAALLLLEQNSSIAPSRWIDNVLLVDMYHNDVLPHGLTQMWSLATEVAFYALLPIGMFLLGLAVRARWRPLLLMVLLAVVSAGSLAWSAAAADSLASWGPWVTQALPGYLGWFSLGIALAVLDVDRRHRDEGRELTLVRWCRAAASAPGACWLVAGAALVVAATPIAGEAALVPRTASESVWRSILYGVVAGAVMLPSIFGEGHTRYARTMAQPFLRHLGHISYSLFCCHLIVLALLFEALDLTLFYENLAVVFALTLSVSLVVSEVLYRLVERPFLRLKNAGRPASSRTGTRQDKATSTSS